MILPNTVLESNCACEAEHEIAEALAPAGLRLRLERGQRIFRAGDAVRGVYVIAEGSVRVWLAGCMGEPLNSRIAGVGAVLGLHSALCAQVQLFEAEAVEPIEFIFVETAEVQRVLRQYPELCMKAMQRMCAEVEKTGTRHEAMSRCTKSECVLHQACTGRC